MSLSEAPFLLSASYHRAIGGAFDRGTRAGIKRAFTRAFKALDNGDTRPAVLLSYRWP